MSDDTLVIDCDSMTYLACYKEPSFELRKKKLMNDIEKIQKTLEADVVYCLFKGQGNFRFDVCSTYKGNRTDDKLDEEGLKLKEWVKELTEWAGENIGLACHGAEADDYVGILHNKYVSEGRQVIMSHIDKDLNQLIGVHHNFNKNEIYTITPEVGYHWLCKQVLMGDAADNIEGLKGIGLKKAEKALDGRPIEQWWDLICEMYEAQHKGEWEEKLRICANLVYMRTDEDKLRNLSFDEIKEVMTWITDTGA